MRLLRIGVLALTVGLLLSCGGGGGGAGGSANVGPSAAGQTIGSGLEGRAGGDTGNGTAASAWDDGSAAPSPPAASGGDDGSGVGSGGTGVSTADATGVGAVDGAGSIIVNGLRYDTSNATGKVEDAPNGLQLGMSVKVTGPVNTDFTRGVAHWVESAADIRGPVASVNFAQSSFVILGVTVSTDQETVWADAAGLAAIYPGLTLQVWGLPAAPGVLRATRIEQRPASPPILTGTVQTLNPSLRTFTVGNATIDYSRAVLSGNTAGRPLANGTIVRVRADAILPGNSLVATLVEWWYPLPTEDSALAQFSGVVTDFAGPGSLRVLGFPVDASAAKLTGGPINAVGNGVKVEVGGVVSNGVLRASKLKIRNVPGTGGPASFELIGTVGAFNSPADFRVRGQPINAAGPGVVFVNGQAANLANGVRVDIRGSRVIDGVLMADSVTFE